MPLERSGAKGHDGHKALMRGNPLFAPAERRLIARLRTPREVQRYLNALPYNTEPHGRATLRSFRGVLRHGCAHCLEAALFAAVVLEQHGYPPLVLSFESADELDHVLFVYREHGRWGSVARSRDPGLHGRKAVFATPRALALSYFDPYVDDTGVVTGYAVVNVAAEMADYDWRTAPTNIWKVERMLLDYPHRPIRSSPNRVRRLRATFKAFKAANPGRKPLYYSGQEKWTEIPPEFRVQGSEVQKFRSSGVQEFRVHGPRFRTLNLNP